MKNASILFFVLVAFCITSSINAFEYSGKINAKYEQTELTAGFEFPVEFKWNTSTLYNKPVEISHVKWEIPQKFGDEIKVTFRPYGYKDLVTKYVPVDIISGTSIYGLKVTGELIEDKFWGESLGFITFNPGTLRSLGEWSYNTSVSPNWGDFIHHYDYLKELTLEMKAKKDILYFTKDTAIKVYQDKFKLTNFNVHSAHFDLSNVKKWFFEDMLQRRGGILAIGIELTIELIEKDPSKQHPKLKKLVQDLKNKNTRESVTKLHNIYYNITAKSPPKGFEISEDLKVSFAFKKIEVLRALNSLYDLNGNIEKFDDLHAQELERIANEKQNILERVNARKLPNGNIEKVDVLHTQELQQVSDEKQNIFERVDVKKLATTSLKVSPPERLNETDTKLKSNLKNLDLFNSEIGVITQYYNNTDKYKVCSFNSNISGFVFIVPPYSKSDIELPNEYRGEDLFTHGERCIANYPREYQTTTEDIENWHKHLIVEADLTSGPAIYARNGGTQFNSVSSIKREMFKVEVEGQEVGRAYRLNNKSSNLEVCAIKSSANSNNKLAFFVLPNTSVTQFILANNKGEVVDTFACMPVDMQSGKAMFGDLNADMEMLLIFM